MSPVRVEVVGETDIGLVRERNEDVFLILDLNRGERLQEGGSHPLELGEGGVLLSVFDGMGGAAGGDRASRLAAEVFAEGVQRSQARTRPALLQSMSRSIYEANRRIRAEGLAQPSLRGMGTTITAAALLEGTLLLLHVGDSRAYLFRGGRLVQLTEDQSLIQELLASGQIQREEIPLFEHNNVILQALGVSDDLAPFAAELTLRQGDLVLLCTDGLTTLVPQQEIAEVLGGKLQSLEVAARSLTSLARERGGHDNVTLLLARVEGDELDADDPEADGVQVRRLDSPRGSRRPGLGPFALVALAVILMLAVASVILLIGMDWR